MRIYYFGELIEVDGKKVEKETKIQQTKLEFETVKPAEKPGMSSVGELLKDIDLNLDIYRPLRLQGQA